MFESSSNACALFGKGRIVAHAYDFGVGGCMVFDSQQLRVGTSGPHTALPGTPGTAWHHHAATVTS
jgi:hypothetical protein